MNNNFFEKPIDLIDRNADEERDSFVEIVNTRQTFNNVTKKQVSRGDQITPTIHDNKAQTTTSVAINSWFQYTYDYKPIDIQAYNAEKTRAIEKFFSFHTDDICDEVNFKIIKILYYNEK